MDDGGARRFHFGHEEEQVALAAPQIGGGTPVDEHDAGADRAGRSTTGFVYPRCGY